MFSLVQSAAASAAKIIAANRHHPYIMDTNPHPTILDWPPLPPLLSLSRTTRSFQLLQFATSLSSLPVTGSSSSIIIIIKLPNPGFREKFCQPFPSPTLLYCCCSAWPSSCHAIRSSLSLCASLFAPFGVELCVVCQE